MKGRFFAIFVILISLSVAVSGCTAKTYMFDFTIEPDLARSDGEWTTASSNYSLSSAGMILKNIWAAAPHLYNGDFEVEYGFVMKTSSTYHVQVNLLLASQVNFNSADWWGGFCITDTGNQAGDHRLYFWENGALYPITTAVPVTQILHYPGDNTLLLIKKGDKLKFKLNDVALDFEHEITSYLLDWYCPHLASSYETMAPWDLAVYKSLKVTYKGEQVPVDI